MIAGEPDGSAADDVRWFRDADVQAEEDALLRIEFDVAEDARDGRTDDQVAAEILANLGM